MRILFRLLRNLIKLLFLPLALYRRSQAAPQGAFIALEIDGRVTDIEPPPRPWQWRRKPATTLHGLSLLIDEILEDSRPKGLLLTIRSFQGGMSTATSLRALLTRLRTSGREVIVHLPMGAGAKEVYVATAANRIFCGPQTSLAPLGFVVNARYLKGALRRVGLTPQIFARGSYKSAGETLTRDAMSEAQREQLDAILTTYYDELVDGIAEGRHVDIARARAIVDGAPYGAADAVRAGLVDAEAYEDEIFERLAEPGKKAVIVNAGAYVRMRRSARLSPLRTPGVVGVVRVHGAIATSSPLGFGLAGEEDLLQIIRGARQNPHVKAVLLHVDSPGGSALASDRIHHELVRLAADKPLVACLANVAASGGYYVAAPAHAIIAEPTTITGSIGVVAARFEAEALLARIGVATSHLRYGAHAGLLDPIGPLTVDEVGAVNQEIEGIYQGFVKVVADGRKRTTEEIYEVAEGRVWTGKDAALRGLVDKLGGFDLALATARERVGVGGEKLAPEVLRPPRRMITAFDPERRDKHVMTALVQLAGLLSIDLPTAILAASGERVLALCTLDLPK